MKKSGISLTTMVIYVILFFIFMTFAIAMSSNMNYKTLTEKGEIINKESIDKLEYNLVNSSLNSNSLEKSNNYLSFSNGDVYVYDAEKKVITKNGGTLIQNVEVFNPVLNYTSLTNVDTNAKNNVNRYTDYACIEIKLSKYGKDTIRQLFVSARGDGVND